MIGLDNPAATGGLALLASLLIQYLKNTSWATWVRRDTAKANLALSVAIAFVTSMGIHWTWNSGTDTIMIVGVRAALEHNIWQWLIQWAAQHTAYKGIVVPSETLGEIRALLARAVDGGPVSEGDAKVQAAGEKK